VSRQLDPSLVVLTSVSSERVEPVVRDMAGGGKGKVGFDPRGRYAVDPRQEFLGLGAANLLAGLWEGFPVAGGLPVYEGDRAIAGVLQAHRHVLSTVGATPGRQQWKREDIEKLLELVDEYVPMLRRLQPFYRDWNALDNRQSEGVSALSKELEPYITALVNELIDAVAAIMPAAGGVATGDTAAPLERWRRWTCPGWSTSAAPACACSLNAAVAQRLSSFSHRTARGTVRSRSSQSSKISRLILYA